MDWPIIVLKGNFELQDYLGRYQDLRDEWKNRKPGGESTDIIDDIVFPLMIAEEPVQYGRKMDDSSNR